VKEVAEAEVAEGEENERDELYDRAVELVQMNGQASTSFLQRRLRVGYNRAARMIEMMEEDGIVAPADGAKPREVLVRKNMDGTEREA
jgi:S-DNA-T family DNA segregation ATPase FtsK/SpoIIIE